MLEIDRSAFKAIGESVHFDPLVDIRHPELVRIGDDVAFHNGVFVNPCGAWVDIGSHTHFAPYSVLYGPLTIGRLCGGGGTCGFCECGTRVRSNRYSDGETKGAKAGDCRGR